MDARIPGWPGNAARGAVLDYAPDGSNADPWSEADGSAGLRGYRIAADKYAEAKAVLAAMISAGAEPPPK